ncbi:MAG: nucleoside monophosphate kinase [Patescibacteria group bacterium]
MIAIIFYGPPGSGKGTQARLIADKLGLIHFDTGKYIESVVHNPANKKNKEIQKQRKMFDSGLLCEPAWVLKIIKERVEQLALIGSGVVFSGSPRTLFEAFGDKKNIGLIKILEKYYGKKNIFIFNIDIAKKESIKRNSSRLMCSVCGTQLLATFKKIAELKICPFCGSKLYRRTLDKSEIIKIRLKEYQERTLPIPKELKKQGYRVIRINGEPLPGKVTQSILKWLL